MIASKAQPLAEGPLGSTSVPPGQGLTSSVGRRRLALLPNGRRNTMTAQQPVDGLVYLELDLLEFGVDERVAVGLLIENEFEPAAVLRQRSLKQPVGRF